MTEDEWTSATDQVIALAERLGLSVNVETCTWVNGRVSGYGTGEPAEGRAVIGFYGATTPPA